MAPSLIKKTNGSMMMNTNSGRSENQTNRRRSLANPPSRVTGEQTRLLESILLLNKNYNSYTDLTKETKPIKPPRRKSLGSSNQYTRTKVKSVN